MAAGLHPDPLGELKRSPDPLAATKGSTSKARGREGRGEEGKGREREGREKRGEERGWIGRGPHLCSSNISLKKPGTWQVNKHSSLTQKHYEINCNR